MSARSACTQACLQIAKARQAWATGTTYRDGAKYLERAISVAEGHGREAEAREG